MYNVSTDRKLALRNSTRQFTATFTFADNSTITSDDDIKGFEYSQEGGLLKSSMKQIKVTYFGTHVCVVGDEVSASLGTFLLDETPDSQLLGTFVVDKVEINSGNGYTTATCYDLLYKSQQAWDYSVVDNTDTFPMTLKDLLIAICTTLGLTLGTATFPNDDLAIPTDIFTDLGLTYRQIIEQIAEASGTLIYMGLDGVNDRVLVRSIGSEDDTLTASDLKKMTIGQLYGGINSVVLSRMPQEDNIVQNDGSTETEIKIINNLIVDAERETWITEIYNNLHDLSYYPSTLETFLMGYYEVGDRITVTDFLENSYSTVITSISWKLSSNGTSEVLVSKAPTKTTTPYQYAGIIGQTIRNTEIIVDRQQGEIDLINSTLITDYYTRTQTDAIITITANAIQSQVDEIITEVDENGNDIAVLQNDVTTLTQTSTELELAVSGIGGVNLLKNSVGLKGTIDEWGTEGTIVDVDADDLPLSNFTESKSGIKIDEETITQSVPAIIGETYTLFFKYQRTGDATVNITGVGDVVLDGTEGEWITFKQSFIASDNITVTFSNGAGDSCILSDIILKIGDCNAWSPAPNEVYGSNFRFDKDGFSVTSLTNPFKSTLDETQLEIVDTSSGDKQIMVVSKDNAKLTNTIVQDSLQVQRYDNSANSARILPTETGAMLVIND